MLENQDTSNRGKWFRILLAPVWLIMELITYFHHWNTIKHEFIENDKLFEFLDKNEFGIERGKFIKKDLIDSVEYLRGRPIDECRNIIRREYTESVFDLINNNCTFNIGEIIALLVSTETFVNKDEKTGEVTRHNIYSVAIQYVRLWWLTKAIHYSIVWIITLGIIFSLYYFIFTDILK